MSQAGEPRVRITDVVFPPTRQDRLADRTIETPEPGSTSDVYAFKVRGHATGNADAVTAAEVAHRGMVLQSVPVHDGAIALDIGALDLPYDFHVAVRAVLADGIRAPVAAVQGTRAALPAAPGPGPAPVLVTTIGRSGSTALATLLCHHPEAAGYRTWDTETRVVSYWAGVLQALARPASYERQLYPAGGMEGLWWTGERPPHPDFPADEPALPALGRSGVEALASFCRSQIGSAGAALAAAAGKLQARHLVEKAQPHHLRSIAEVSEELDPRSREVVLVRDFRDVTCSMLAYSRRGPSKQFGPGAGATVEDMIRWLSHNGASGLVDYVQRRGDRAYVLRYEDLVTRSEPTLTRLLEFIGADSGSETVTAMLRGLAQERDRAAHHATTSSAEQSIGRWRNELDGDQQELAEHLFRPHLDALGYE
jgi:hypothetical protein